jgi:hypothetical protein
MERRHAFVLLASAALGGASSMHASSLQANTASGGDHMAWVAKVLKRMESIHPGMTRENLLTVSTIEGGLSTGLRRTFVSRDCPYFKVDVEFQAVGRPERDGEGRVTLVAGNEDIILVISKPYLEFSIMD